MGTDRFIGTVVFLRLLADFPADKSIIDYIG